MMTQLINNLLLLILPSEVQVTTKFSQINQQSIDTYLNLARDFEVILKTIPPESRKQFAEAAIKAVKSAIDPQWKKEQIPLLQDSAEKITTYRKQYTLRKLLIDMELTIKKLSISLDK